MVDSVALFIDLENVVTSLWKTYQQSPDLFRWMEQVRAYGPLAFGRAYGDFNQPSIAKLEGDLRSLGIDKFDCPPKQNGQSTVDSNVIIDIYEVAFDQPAVKTFVLMAGDSDYVRVVAKLRQRLDKHVVIMGVPGSVSRELVRAAGSEEQLQPMAPAVIRDDLVIRIIDRYESSRREGTYPTFRYMSQYLQHPSNNDVIPAQLVHGKLNELLEAGILIQTVIALENGNEITTTRLERTHPDVISALSAD